jgi:hypothetical protein
MPWMSSAKRMNMESWRNQTMMRMNRDRLRQRYALSPNIPVIFKSAVSVTDLFEGRRGSTRTAYDNSVVITATILTLGTLSAYLGGGDCGG